MINSDENFQAAIIIILNEHYIYMKGVKCSDEPTENYYLTLQPPSELFSTHCFGFKACKCFWSLSLLSATVHYLVNIKDALASSRSEYKEYLAVKQRYIFLRRW